MDENRLKVLVDKLITDIRTGAFDTNRMLQLYENWKSAPGLAESDRERLIEEIEKRMREDAPRKATRIFGGKDMEFRELLGGVWQNAESRFDLRNNVNKPGVKTGGNMLSGMMYVEVYLSFRNQDKERASIDIAQEAADADPVVTVKAGTVGFREEYIRKYGIKELELAENDFMSQLARIAP